MPEIQRSFEEGGYCHARGDFRADEVAALERDFDRIVAQLAAGRQGADVTWEGPEVRKTSCASTGSSAQTGARR